MQQPIDILIMLTKEYLRLLEKRKEVQPNLSYSYERVSKARIQRAKINAQRNNVRCREWQIKIVKEKLYGL